MDKNSRITYRVPELFRDRISQLQEEKSWGDAEFMLMVLNHYFNPPLPKIVESVKLVDGDGVVHNPRTEKTVELTDMLFEEFKTRRRDEGIPMQQFVNSWINIKMDNEKKYQVKPAAQQTNASPQTNGASFNSPAFEEFKQMKRDCETPEDWQELKKEISSTTTLTEKQKSLLINTPLR